MTFSETVSNSCCSLKLAWFSGFKHICIFELPGKFSKNHYLVPVLETIIIGLVLVLKRFFPQMIFFLIYNLKIVTGSHKPGSLDSWLRLLKNSCRLLFQDLFLKIIKTVWNCHSDVNKLIICSFDLFSTTCSSLPCTYSYHFSDFLTLSFFFKKV